MATDEKRMAAEVMGEWECPKCGMLLSGEDAVGRPHGWPVRTDPVEVDAETGAEVWRFLQCADAADEQVAFYRAVKAAQARAAGGGA